MTGKLSRMQMAWRVAQDLEDGFYVNLGTGMPLAVPLFIPKGRTVVFHSENGILGVGPPPPKEEEDERLINAGTRPITIVPGGAYFHHADSFLMIRGGHLDACVLGAFQVSGNGDLANWNLDDPKSRISPAVGGAMDLAYGAKSVFVIMEHCAKDGSPKIVERCTLSLTGVACVSRVYTDFAVMSVTPDGLVVDEMVEGLSFEELQALTGAPLKQSRSLGAIKAPEIKEPD